MAFSEPQRTERVLRKQERSCAPQLPGLGERAHPGLGERAHPGLLGPHQSWPRHDGFIALRCLSWYPAIIQHVCDSTFAT